jgi:hypothetical protein
MLFLAWHFSASAKGRIQRCILARWFTAPGEASAGAARCIQIERAANNFYSAKF